jgi:hypothetical protein
VNLYYLLIKIIVIFEDFISKTVEQTRREESYLGVPICGGWGEYYIYDHANA